MDAKDLIDNLKKSICSGLEVEERTLNRYMIHTGYTYPDGDELHILMVYEGGHWLFSDEGHTMMWLSYEDFELTEARKALFDRTLKANGVSFKDGSLCIPIGMDYVSSIDVSLKSLIQAEIQIADLLYLDKESVKDTFMEDLKTAFSSSSISDKCLYDYKLLGEGNTEFIADVYIKSKIPILVFGIHTALQCSRATVTMLSLSKMGSQYMFMAVFEDNSKVPTRDRNAAINAAIKTTIGLEEVVEGAERLISLQ